MSTEGFTPISQRMCHVNGTLLRHQYSILYPPKGSPEIQPGYDFYSRYFAPWNGVPEDPVTGTTPPVAAHSVFVVLECILCRKLFKW